MTFSDSVWKIGPDSLCNKKNRNKYRFHVYARIPFSTCVELFWILSGIWRAGEDLKRKTQDLHRKSIKWKTKHIGRFRNYMCWNLYSWKCKICFLFWNLGFYVSPIIISTLKIMVTGKRFLPYLDRRNPYGTSIFGFILSLRPNMKNNGHMTNYMGAGGLPGG
jgi:hypothetical protein